MKRGFEIDRRARARAAVAAKVTAGGCTNGGCAYPDRVGALYTVMLGQTVALGSYKSSALRVCILSQFNFLYYGQSKEEALNIQKQHGS